MSDRAGLGGYSCHSSIITPKWFYSYKLYRNNDRNIPEIHDIETEIR